MILEIEQSALDIDWFFTDNKYIGFVASAGGKLPRSVSNSKDNIELLASYFRALPKITDVEINPNLKEVIPTRAITESYLSDFIFMAERGLYSFDKTLLNNFDDDRYHLVASPLVSLTINDLPLEISQIVVQTTSINRINEGFNSSLLI